MNGVLDGATLVRTEQAVMKHHHVVRDGSFWCCLFCGRQWPFPSPVPADTEPCDPRPWPAGSPQIVEQNGPESRRCQVCGAPRKMPCLNLRSVNRPAIRPHKER